MTETLTYRCPQCGATYPAPGTCSNQHPVAELVAFHEAAGTPAAVETAGTVQVPPGSATPGSTPPQLTAADVQSIVSAAAASLSSDLRSAIGDAVGTIQTDAAANLAELKAELDRQTANAATIAATTVTATAPADPAAEATQAAAGDTTATQGGAS